jgi:arsenate reductase
VDFEEVDYTAERLSKRQLKDLVKKLGIPPRELLRKREASFKKLNLGSSDRSDTEILEAMASHPELIQRPIVVKGQRAVLARPVDRVKELI